VKFPQLKEKVLELPKHLRKRLFVAILRSIKESERETLIPDDICPSCFGNIPNGKCWFCYEESHCADCDEE